jgi:hypothetical protein
MRNTDEQLQIFDPYCDYCQHRATSSVAAAVSCFFVLILDFAAAPRFQRRQRCTHNVFAEFEYYGLLLIVLVGVPDGQKVLPFL